MALAVESQQRVAAQDRAHRRVGLPRGEDIAATREDLLDVLRIREHDDVAEGVGTHREQVAVAAPGPLHERERTHGPQHGLDPARDARARRRPFHYWPPLGDSAPSLLCRYLRGRHRHLPSLEEGEPICTYVQYTRPSGRQLESP